MTERDSDRSLLAVEQGIKAVADYIHARGLLFGMYSCAGPLTCAGSAPPPAYTHGWAGMYQHECQDAQQFADWQAPLLLVLRLHRAPQMAADGCRLHRGVDYLFEDFCSAPKPGRELYPITSACLNKTGRPIFFLMCIWGQEEVARW